MLWIITKEVPAMVSTVLMFSGQNYRRITSVLVHYFFVKFNQASNSIYYAYSTKLLVDNLSDGYHIINHNEL